MKSPEKVVHKNEPVNKNIESDNEENQNCFACKQKHPPIKRYPKNHWIQCDNCDEWWHIECACITKEDNEKLTRHKINYSCAICVLKGSSWIQAHHNLPLTDTIINISPIDNKKDICGESESKPTNQTKPNQTNDSESYVNSAANNKTDKDCFIVIDNIPSPKKFRSSVEIRKEIKKFPDLDKPKHSFSLPKGGIALQYEDKCSVEKTLESWPKEAFGSESLPHKAVGVKL